MINIKPFKQSPGMCGPACLKMIFEYYGINKSEKELAKLTKTTPTRGCFEKDMVRASNQFGFKAVVKDKSSIKELRKLVSKGIPVIVDWFSPIDAGHYSVVVGFSGSKILIADPLFGKIMKYNLKWFEERWIDVIKNKLILKGVIIIRK